MRNTVSALIIAALALGFATLPAHAAQSSKEEAIGIGSGAVIGAAAGGPVGFFIGAALGARLGDTWHDKNAKLDELETSLAASRGSVTGLQGDIDTLSAELERLRGVARPELVSLMQAGIAMDLLFRTDETALAKDLDSRLMRLAGTLASMPEIRIQLDGFADERGDETYNFGLSEKRVDFVRERFVNAGVAPERIAASAHGESAAADDSIDSLALERRVSVRLFIDDAPAVAANPD